MKGRNLQIVSLDLDPSPLVAGYKRKRDLIYNGLNDKYDGVKPEGHFTSIPRPLKKNGAVCGKSRHSNVFLIPGGVFSQRATHFRISFAVWDETIEKGWRSCESSISASFHKFGLYSL